MGERKTELCHFKELKWNCLFCSESGIPVVDLKGREKNDVWQMGPLVDRYEARYTNEVLRMNLLAWSQKEKVTKISSQKQMGVPDELYIDK